MWFSTEKKNVGKNADLFGLLGYLKHLGHNILCRYFNGKKTAPFLSNLWLTERLSLFYNEGHAMFQHSLF